MSQILQKQIENLKTKHPFKESGNEIVFLKDANEGTDDKVKVVFESYFITGFPGFDFHDKFNNGIAPFEKVMYGKILKETDKMYYFDLHSISGDKKWVGWSPKKSCTVTNI